ncbi:MAG: hypothetical protein HQ513_08525 [Rhodospirillales bacterium]|nr:hypothetical protein [Rhodospirillales bacterium]
MPSIENKDEMRPGILLRHPKISLGLIMLTTFLLFLVLAEIALRLLAPLPFSNVGFVNTPNGLRFGWGFEPYGLVRIEDPDTGKVSSDRVNNKGWRDRDRTYENPNNAFRVVILGDSQTFGFIVPKEKTYTWVLEDRLRAEGMNVEIINISYSGWSTSQQLEALEQEGMKYHPDLVIVNFVDNDIDENFRHTGSGKFANRVPFFHETETDGELARRDNPNFAKERDAITRKYILSKSEILKRLWMLKLARNYAGEKSHIFTKGQIGHVDTVLGEAMPERLKTAMSQMVDRQMDLPELEKFLDAFNLDEEMRQVILRITENRSFQRELFGEGYFGTPELSDRHWPLYFQLMERMKTVAETGGARLALSTDQGPGRYNWERSWYRIPSGETGKRFFYMVNDRLRSFANSIGISFIEPLTNDERARNDSHLNETGNRQTAINLYDFLIGHYGVEIRKR